MNLIRVLFLVILLLIAPIAHTAPTTGPRIVKKAPVDPNKPYYKLVHYDKKQAYFGYNLYPASGPDETLLLDMEGKIINKWSVDVTRARLLPNCNLLVVHGSDSGRKRDKWRKVRPIVREYDWDGKIVWQYRTVRPAHHDIRRLKNGNTIFLTRTPVLYNIDTKQHISGKAAQKEKIKPNQRKIQSDIILEVNGDGEVAWRWDAQEHLDLESCGQKNCETSIADVRWMKAQKDWTHGNAVSVLGDNPWYAAGDKRFAPGNVMFTARSWWSILLIDRKSKKVVWEYPGNVDDEIIKPHEGHLIAQGLPGAGNLLIFDNGSDRKRNHSRVIEVNPVSGELVWSYEDPEHFYSSAAGSVQRLPNGNTLISEDVPGNVFEVTPKGEKVWEIKGEYRLSRVHRYAPNYCPKLAKLDS